MALDSIAPCPTRPCPISLQPGRTGRVPGRGSSTQAARTPPAATAGERAALTGSIVASAVCGGLAVVWGVLSGARIILFDGAYALIGIGIAGLSLRIAHAVAAGPTRRFPFGRDALTPMMVVAQGVALVATLFYAGADAVDPVLVLVACAVLVPTPLRLLRSGTVELLEGEPSAEISDAVRATVEEVRQRFGLDEPIVRLHKLGRKLYVEVDFVVEPGEWDVSEEDGVRRAVADGLAPLGPGRLGVRGAHDGPGAGGVTGPVTHLSRPRHDVLSTGVGFRRATSARTRGATCVPSSSIAVITERCGTVPSANCTRVRS